MLLEAERSCIEELLLSLPVSPGVTDLSYHFCPTVPHRLQSAKLAVGLKEGNKSILEKNLLGTSVLAVLGSLFIKLIVDSAGGSSSDGEKRQ